MGRICGAHCFVQRFLAAKNMAVVPHSFCSPDLAPCSFFLFPRMKSKPKGHRVQDVIEIQEQLHTVLHAIPKVSFSGVSISGSNAGPVA
jgi:hypothetical protein